MYAAAAATAAVVVVVITTTTVTKLPSYRVPIQEIPNKY